MDKEQEKLLQEWTNNYNEAEKKIQQIEKDASGVVSERFKQFFRQQMAEQQHIQYVNWKKIDDMLSFCKFYIAHLFFYLYVPQFYIFGLVLFFLQTKIRWLLILLWLQ